MTTLGDVFGKLSGVRLLSILKWYGRIVMWGFIALGVGMIITGVTCLLFWFVASVPWYFTVGLLVLGSGWLALKIADPDALRSDFDRKMDKMNQDILAGKYAPMREKGPESYQTFDNWAYVRETVDAMPDDMGCNIAVHGDLFNFANKQEALDFLDGKSAAVKSQ